MFDREPDESVLDLKDAQWKRLSSSIYPNKSLKKVLDISKALQEIDADIVMLIEVGGLESLANLNKLFLSSQYSCYLVEGNSDRNIDVGFLVKKNLPFDIELKSNKNRPINYLYPHERESIEKGYSDSQNSSHYFSRDVVELRLSQGETPAFLQILLTHLKSRLDPERIDPNGFERRQAELKTLLDIYTESRSQNKIPTVVAGDFNGNASRIETDEEFKEIYTRTDLLDVLEVCQLPQEERATFYQVRNGGRADGRQIDFVFLSEELHPLVKPQSAYVYQYKNHRGETLPPPRSLDAKSQLPSDHYPLVFEIENLKLSL